MNKNPKPDTPVVIRYIDLPGSTRALLSMDIDGTANIYVNARLSYEAQQAAIRHEMAHLARNDLYGEWDIRKAEQS